MEMQANLQNIIYKNSSVKRKKEENHSSFSVLRLYLSLVAMPPRICLSLKFKFSTWRTSSNKSASIRRNLSETSLCTVDLLMEKCAEHARTVHPVSIMYSAHLMTRSSIYSHKIPTSVFDYEIYLCRFFAVYN